MRYLVEGQLPDYCIINVQVTFDALCNINQNKATGRDNILAWLLKEHAATLAAQLTAIYNNSLREGKLPNEWKMPNVIPVHKVPPPLSIYKNIRPISLPPIAAKIFESIVMKSVDDAIELCVDPKQFGGLSSTSTTDVFSRNDTQMVLSY